ncbi:MAG: bifunctional folylpolyglutamate synthase/dihydrofolate synthase [Candidatus Omnitrophica bacterium]|nr:bifunctional folylpolyglutamate synthase/dihydrofolate synthase [Candidatus Omnitrophota bacterium]
MHNTIHEQMNDYDQAIKYLEEFINYEKVGLDRIEKEFDLANMYGVLKAMGNPHKQLNAVHIAGTKGKGSVSAMISSVLRESGYNVGLFVSPHLSDITERISVNGTPISREDFAGILEKISRFVSPQDFTYFEVITLAAIVYFYDLKVDYTVFEAGLGGRLDATNVLEPLVTVLTPIGFDHTDVLGPTIAKIAYEKAGIIKNGVDCVSADQKDEAWMVIKKKCEAVGANFYYLGRDIQYRTSDVDENGTVFYLKTPGNAYSGLRTKMTGAFQVRNASLAAAVCEILLKGRLEPAHLSAGLYKAFLPGRLEMLAEKPSIIVDGAHDVMSASELRTSVEDIFDYDKLILVMGLSRDKDAEGILREIAPVADEIIFTRSLSPRAQDPFVLRGFVRGRKAKVTTDSKEALGAALKSAGEKDLILVMGSFYLVGEIRELILKKEKGERQKEKE